MTDQSKIVAAHKGINQALAAAQMAMGPALKSSVNPAFKSKYADLASVLDACLPALNAHGIAVIQPTFDDETGRWVKTIFLHESGEALECRVPLIVGKNDMQGYGSAVTYARRYGLMSMAGIAPEDDDGNAAAKAAPVAESPQAYRIGVDQFLALQKRAEDAGVPAEKLCTTFGVESLEVLTVPQFQSAMKKLQATIDAKPKANADLGEDKIPY